MNLKKYTNILQIVSVALCLSIIYLLFGFAPRFSVLIAAEYSQFIPFLYLWLGIFWIEGLPIVLCGLICMRLYENIGNNEIFTRENIRLLNIIKKIVVFLILFILFGTIFSIYFYLVYKVGFVILHIVYLLVMIVIYFVLKTILLIVENGVELQEDQDLTV